MDVKAANEQLEGEAFSLSDGLGESTSSPGRARRVSMKIKKGLKEVKGMLSPHRHPHQHGHGPRCHDRDGGRERRKSGPPTAPTELRRGPLAPVLDRLEKDKSVPIHLHISHNGSFSITRKASSSSYSTSDIAPDDSNSLADIHQHIQAEEEKQQEREAQSIEPEPPKPELEQEMQMEVPEPFIASPSPPSLEPSVGDEETPNPFLVDDPEDPLSEPEPGSPPPAPVPPLDPIILVTEVPPPEPVVPPPAAPLELSPPPASPVIEKPVPPLPASSDTESEPEVPAVHLPQLVLPTMFLPIPNVRISSHLTWWLTRRTPTYY